MSFPRRILLLGALLAFAVALGLIPRQADSQAAAAPAVAPKASAFEKAI